MGDDQSNVTFNVGEQRGNITNIGRDQIIHGDQTQHHIIGSADELRDELTTLREVLGSLDLDDGVVAEAGDLIDEADAELSVPQPQPEQVSRPLERLTEVLTDAGALAAAGAALIEPLQRIGGWLGTSGQALLRLLR